MTTYKDGARCRECEHWTPEWQGQPSLAGVCSITAPFTSYTPGGGWGAAPSWYGARLCRGFVASVGAQAVAQLEAVCNRLWRLPLDDRRVELARMEREDSAAAETIKGRMVDMARERAAARAAA